ncbi:hypothetical protein ACHAW6_000404 [Cyclotella cf. meneghiniana]
MATTRTLEHATLSTAPHHHPPLTPQGTNHGETSLCMASGNAPEVPSSTSASYTNTSSNKVLEPSKEAQKAKQHHASILASKWDQAYSDTMNFVHVQMSLAIVQSNTLLLCEDRNHSLRRRAPTDRLAAASYPAIPPE